MGVCVIQEYKIIYIYIYIYIYDFIFLYVTHIHMPTHICIHTDIKKGICI